MPAGDRRGPDGLGPMTGRGAGYCAGYPVPGYENPGAGRGFGGGRGRGGWGRGGWGRGAGFGRGGRFFAPVRPDYGYPYPVEPIESTVSEVDQLKRQAKSLSQTLRNLEKRIADLTTPEEPEKEE